MSRAAKRRRSNARRARKRSARARRGRLRIPHGALRALTSSALALPGIAGSAAAQTPAERASVDYSYGFYKEGKLPRSKVSQGDREPYEIDIHQFRAAAFPDSCVDSDGKLLGLDRCERLWACSRRPPTRGGAAGHGVVRQVSLTPWVAA